MIKTKITIEYDGTSLLGWQKQLDGDSVQSCLERAIYKLTQEDIEVFGAGRTDAGVHAIAQVAHFETNKGLNEYQLLEGLNFYLREQSSPVSVIAVEFVADDFHARFSAIKRSYVYKILNRQAPPIIDKNRVWWIPQTLDVAKMIEASQCFLGTHDFSSFRAAACQAKSPIKSIDKIEITQNAENIEIYVEAKSFLHHQVRNIVGTLRDVGIGKTKPEEIVEIFEKCDRKAAGATAPACGLYLNKVEY